MMGEWGMDEVLIDGYSLLIIVSFLHITYLTWIQLSYFNVPEYRCAVNILKSFRVWQSSRRPP